MQWSCVRLSILNDLRVFCSQKCYCLKQDNTYFNCCTSSSYQSQLQTKFSFHLFPNWEVTLIRSAGEWRQNPVALPCRTGLGCPSAKWWTMLMSQVSSDVLSGAFEDLVAVQAPLEILVIVTLCPSYTFLCNFNAQYTLPVLSDFPIQNFIKVQLRGILILGTHWFISHHKSCEQLFCNLWDENPWVYIQNYFSVALCFSSPFTSAGFKHLFNLQWLEKWGLRFFRCISLHS